jgi:hypothetical protein
MILTNKRRRRRNANYTVISPAVRNSPRPSRDPTNDIAFVKIKDTFGKHLPVEFISTGVKVGQFVVASPTPSGNSTTPCGRRGLGDGSRVTAGDGLAQ